MYRLDTFYERTAKGNFLAHASEISIPKPHDLAGLTKIIDDDNIYYSLKGGGERMLFSSRLILSVLIVGAWAPYDCPDSLAKYGAWLCIVIFVIMVWLPEGADKVPESGFTRKKFGDGPRRGGDKTISL
jgi:hypothetical protein